MAEIIGYQKKTKQLQRYKAICNECGAIIIFDEDEVVHLHGNNEYQYTNAKCPGCGSKFSFDKDKCKYDVKEIEIQEPLVTIKSDITRYINQNGKTLDSPIFKTGDKVCYKHRPDVCIGTISPDSFVGNFDGYYQIFTSGEWFESFAPYGGPNTISEPENKLMLYKLK